MQWQARVRQALKRKDIEMSLLELSMHQPKQEPQNVKDQANQERKGNKRSKLKSKLGEHEQSSDCGGSDDDNHGM